MSSFPQESGVLSHSKILKATPCRVVLHFQGIHERVAYRREVSFSTLLKMATSWGWWVAQLLTSWHFGRGTHLKITPFFSFYPAVKIGTPLKGIAVKTSSPNFFNARLKGNGAIYLSMQLCPKWQLVSVVWTCQPYLAAILGRVEFDISSSCYLSCSFIYTLQMR